MISLRFSCNDEDINNYMCVDCKKANNWSAYRNKMLPVWYDEAGQVQYHVPPQLSCLREGEKLLIQQVAVYVPLHHLMYGQIGCRGHIVSFPQNISSVCKTLPRLPSNVSTVRVIKRFKLSNGDISSTSFVIRKKVVMEALIWLKRFNKQYSDIDICEGNLDWIENGGEQLLPASVSTETIDPDLLSNEGKEDCGPSQEQILDQIKEDDCYEPTYGISNEYNVHKPKEKDRSVVEALKKAEMEGQMLNVDKDGKVIRFPYVSSEPICEYSEKHLFEYAFPWLFPGGTGGYMSGPNPKPLLKDWLKKMTQYKDGRFDHDRLWAFFALNYATRHNNQGSGNFFVKTFFEKGPKTLEGLQEEVGNGRLEWLDRISYFSQCVPGSSAYWRARRREVFAWINYHVEKGNGVPTFFITLSCAEYHWKDIERLISDRCKVAGMPPPDFTKGE
jgi:translation initiation factor 2 beta subunit (eIF-2beta)/eIF-5